MDCGLLVHPSSARARVEGAAMDGVATVLEWGATLEPGRVRESNFDGYPLLRMPQVAGGVNAVAAASGRRLRRLPLQPGDLE